MSSNIQKLARHLAGYGRNGDSIAVHMHPLEITAIERLTGRKATTNPITGMKEGFAFLIPLITAIAGGLASSAISKTMNKNKTAETQDTKATDYAEAQGRKALAQHQIPLIRLGGVPSMPAGYVPGVSGERTMTPIRQPIGTIGANGVNWNPPGYADGGMVPEQEDASELIHEAMEALAGNSENPEEVLNRFVSTFGMEALQQLMGATQGGGEQEEGMAHGGMLKGPGGGMDDLMTARVRGGQPIAVSGDEYVVPADVVSALGDGSSDAGGRKLDAMALRIRMAKTGRGQQPQKISNRVMPA
jgi:hypothetical protein